MMKITRITGSSLKPPDVDLKPVHTWFYTLLLCHEYACPIQPIRPLAAKWEHQWVGWTISNNEYMPRFRDE